ncbi:hypothetical protein BU17DRAFT_100262 [Hysterangium stoloniferum]|nr:hypothetical protein BU17DRAFT_100262 [Hysterangium stoloniferum]
MLYFINPVSPPTLLLILITSHIPFNLDKIENPNQYLKRAAQNTRNAVQKWIAEIKTTGSVAATFHPEPPSEVHIVLYFHESHQLTNMRTPSGIEEGLPADHIRTAYQTLSCVLHSLPNEDVISSNEPNLVTLLSTTSHFTYSPSNTFHSSPHTHQGKLGLQPPILELSFDTWMAGRVITQPISYMTFADRNLSSASHVHCFAHAAKHGMTPSETVPLTLSMLETTKLVGLMVSNIK